MWLLYQVAMAMALVLAGPFLLVRRGRHYLKSLPGRLSPSSPTTSRHALWLHAVSVGEVGVAATLIEALPAHIPILTTTITPTGQERARATLARRAVITYLPFDLGFSIRRFLDRFQPRALILTEGDLWPLLLTRVRRRGLPVLVVNGRVGDRTFGRLRRLRFLLPLLTGRVDRFAVQSDADRERLEELGVEAGRVVVTGNLKYDTPEPPPLPELEERLTRLANGRAILLAGSTMPGEEELVLTAFARAGGGERALLLLAPRHPERFTEVAALVSAHPLASRRRSSLDSIASDPAPADVVLLDTLGELAALYRLALGAFVGGTLVPTGGHNPLEPARFSVPTAVGPSMENFREMAEQFDRARAWARVRNADELGDTWRQWLDEPQAAAELGSRGARMTAASQGALGRTLEFLAPTLALFEERG